LIRLAMSHRVIFSDNELSDDRQLAYLFAADRYDHLHNNVDGVLKQLGEGAVVISTRYYLSSFAYHCRNDEDFARVAQLNEEFPPADLTFYIDCPVETCLRRIEQRQFISEKYEHHAKLAAVRDNFAKALANYRHELHRLDGEAPPDRLHQQVLEVVRPKVALR
jgi:dTMP kinase